MKNIITPLLSYYSNFNYIDLSVVFCCYNITGPMRLILRPGTKINFIYRDNSVISIPIHTDSEYLRWGDGNHYPSFNYPRVYIPSRSLINRVSFDFNIHIDDNIWGIKINNSSIIRLKKYAKGGAYYNINYSDGPFSFTFPLSNIYYILDNPKLINNSYFTPVERSII